MHQVTVGDCWNVICGVLGLASLVLPIGYAIAHKRNSRRAVTETGHAGGCQCAACAWTEYRCDVRSVNAKN